ncbi:hypothetical protein [Chryseobacterium arthrosphaerae]|uniref:hypothetical protein n=1 Tax=Chryseobacterium arthrosphaerae TaxID=651561 RepID=UPI00241D5B1D|nr:hypothetical protein [Chryseobacterium arthrosphaerae]
MKIIALKGKNKSGKTTTLNLVYDFLINIQGNKSTPKKILGNVEQKDFECIVTMINQTTVGFYTMGDYSGMTLQAINAFQIHKVDILILATNSKFKKPTIRINQFPDSHIIIKSVAKLKSVSNSNTENQKDCDHILSLL